MSGATAQSQTATIYVSVKGNDSFSGDLKKPFLTVDMALRKARELRRLSDPSVKNGIHIYVGGGNYSLSEPVILRPEDSGTALSPTSIEAVPGERPVLNGGLNITGWKKATEEIKGLPITAKGEVWVADAPLSGDQPIDFRQLYVNGQKATRARDVKTGKMGRILSWNHKDQTCWIPKPAVDLNQASGVEMFIHQWWSIAVLRVKSVSVKGDSARLSFYQPESRVQSEHPWPAPRISKSDGNSAFYLSNAIQFVNEPGEWFLDKRNQKIYYWPRANENMQAAKVIVPVLETLLKIQGTIDRPVSYVSFIGIGFQYATWLRPSREGHVPHQSGMYMTDAYKLEIPGTADKKSLENQAWVGRPAAAVEASFTNHTAFENCRFEHMGSTGLDYKRGNHNELIQGNVFKDISGTGIQIGVFSDESQEVHFPYQPADQREVCSDIKISNNLITDVSNEDWGTLGISAGVVKGLLIDHNDISEVSYSGISVGWGWTRTVTVAMNNRITANKIQRYGKHMYDVSGIYTLSAQPASAIEGNCVDSIYKAPYAHDPNHWFYLYTDEGSSFFTVKNNWTPTDKYLKNANGPGNVWENNGPWVADSTKRAAGLQKPFQHLLKERAPVATDREINHSQLTKVVELITADGAMADQKKLAAICSKQGLSAANLFHWKNHSIVYGAIEDPNRLRTALKAGFANSDVKIYNAPFYEFERAKHCKGSVKVKDLEHIILTADLVKDSLLQKEYLNYHANQFKDWPEVAQGFCNAEFQELQLFMNAGQLMLIISIPKGADFESLNKKTTANNPRVDEWNTLMKNYQRGLQGTQPGETWVFLEKFRN